MHDAPKISRTGAGKAYRLLSSVILAKQSFSTDYSFKPPKTCRRPKKKTMTLKYRHVRVMSRPCQSPDNGRVGGRSSNSFNRV